MATSTVIYNTITREQAERLAGILEGKTYMNFRVGIVPAGGSFDVVVETSRPDTSVEELRGMVTEVLVGVALECRSGSTPSGEDCPHD